MKRLFLPVLVLARLTAWSGFADDSIRTTRVTAPHVVVEVQMVVIPQEGAAPLLRDLQDPGKVEDAAERVQRMLEAGAARLIGWPMVETQSGAHDVSVSYEAMQYATEYMAGYLDLKTAEAAATARLPDERTEMAAVPTYLETRNPGVILEVDSTVSPDGRQVALRLKLERLHFRQANKLVTAEYEKSGWKSTVEQPDFTRSTVATSVTVKSGRHVLLGANVAPDAPGMLELFILRAEVVAEP